VIPGAIILVGDDLFQITNDFGSAIITLDRLVELTLKAGKHNKEGFCQLIDEEIARGN